MRILLDTHALLWLLMGNARLSATARSAIVDPATERWVSPISLLEIAVKFRLGKPRLYRAFRELFPSELQLNDIALLPLEIKHLDLLTSLPLHHRDPFDRLIVATAMIEGMWLASADPVFDTYGVPRCW